PVATSVQQRIGGCETLTRSGADSTPDRGLESRGIEEPERTRGEGLDLAPNPLDSRTQFDSLPHRTETKAAHGTPHGGRVNPEARDHRVAGRTLRASVSPRRRRVVSPSR